MTTSVTDHTLFNEVAGTVRRERVAGPRCPTEMPKHEIGARNARDAVRRPAETAPSVAAQPDYTSDAGRWQAVLAHDPGADGHYFFAVRTTGVFCRPSCKSRTPRRENVSFFETSDEALAAGFRECKRCRPLRAPREVELVARACEVLAGHVDERTSLAQLSAAVHLSPYHLQRVFTRVMGVSPRQYQASLRAERLRDALRCAGSVTGAALDAGFGSATPLRNAARAHLGMKPSVYRKRGAGATIVYATATTRLGTVLVAATEQGVCRIAFGDDHARLVDELRDEFSNATLVCDAQRVAPYIERIDAYLDGRGDTTDMPFDVVATAFQRRVWDALRQIPYGETRSYTEIATELGVPNAVRAVAGACAANPVALVIPCHRVVQKTGALAGYRWGVQRKAALLDGEQRGGVRPSQGRQAESVDA
jgi:AraC family transcriptional regulator, regulatory protein of adaptative response / methylated-DNA-[protein]-cysteine methyltransferase